VVENPYQSPMAELDAVKVNSRRRDARVVAICQKGVIIFILAYLGTGLCLLLLPVPLPLSAGIILLALQLAGLACACLLAAKLYGIAAGVLLGLLILVPLLGLLVLLMINSSATRFLRQNGFRVGLLGADLSTFR
jgi:hypothetical protein